LIDWILCLIKINRLTSAFLEAFHQWISTWKGQKEAMIDSANVNAADRAKQYKKSKVFEGAHNWQKVHA